MATGPNNAVYDGMGMIGERFGITLDDATHRVAETKKPVDGERFNHLEIVANLGEAYASLLQEQVQKGVEPKSGFNIKREGRTV